MPFPNPPPKRGRLSPTGEGVVFPFPLGGN